MPLAGWELGGSASIIFKQSVASGFPPDDIAGMCIEKLQPSRAQDFLVAYLEPVDELNGELPQHAALFLDT
jgi:hypothetical protein